MRCRGNSSSDGIHRLARKSFASGFASRSGNVFCRLLELARDIGKMAKHPNSIAETAILRRLLHP
jgi:hypothetical protein